VHASLQNIRFFVAAFEERSFTAAAAREHATQPGVSHHVRNLEEVLNVQLFVREKGVLIPTPAGTNFYHSCVKVLRAYHESIHGIQPYAGAAGEDLAVGLIPALTRNTLSTALSRFMQREPNVTIRVVEGYTPTLAKMIAAGDLDFAITSTFAHCDGLQARELFESAECLVSRRVSDSTEMQEVDLRQAGALKLIFPGKANAHHQVLDSYITDNEVEIAASIEVESVLGTLELVSHTDWAAILPSVMLRPDDLSRYQVARLVNPDLPFRVVLAKPTTTILSPAAEGMVEELVSAARDIESSWQELAG
jgi:DNA-binding transcriptional LysR family regulator